MVGQNQVWLASTKCGELGLSLIGKGCDEMDR